MNYEPTTHSAQSKRQMDESDQQSECWSWRDWFIAQHANDYEDKKNTSMSTQETHTVLFTH